MTSSGPQSRCSQTVGYATGTERGPGRLRSWLSDEVAGGRLSIHLCDDSRPMSDRLDGRLECAVLDALVRHASNATGRPI
jgi:hypothetical protein